MEVGKRLSIFCAWTNASYSSDPNYFQKYTQKKNMIIIYFYLGEEKGSPSLDIPYAF